MAEAEEAKLIAIGEAAVAQLEQQTMGYEEVTAAMVTNLLVSEGYDKAEADIIAKKVINTTVTKVETEAENTNTAARLANVIATKLQQSALGGLIGRIVTLIALEKVMTHTTATLTGALLLFAAPLAIVGGIVAAIRAYSKEQERQKEILKDQADASNSLVQN